MTAALQAEGVALRADPLISLRHVVLAGLRPEALANLPGGFPGRRKGAGQEVADLREYIAGDDLRHLDRSTSARTGKLHVRQFQQERDRVVLLVADFRASMLWGVSRALLSVATAEVLSLLGWSVIEQGGRVGLLAITPGAPVVVAARGRARGQLDVIGGLVRAHAAALAEAGSQVGPLAGPTLDGALAAVERICPSGAEVVIASGFDAQGAGLGATLDRIAQRRSVRLYEVTDAQDLPPGRYPVRLPDGRRQRLQIGGARAGAGRAQVARQIGGRTAHPIDAALPPQQLAAQLSGQSLSQSPNQGLPRSLPK